MALLYGTFHPLVFCETACYASSLEGRAQGAAGLGGRQKGASADGSRCVSKGMRLMDEPSACLHRLGKFKGQWGNLRCSGPR